MCGKDFLRHAITIANQPAYFVVDLDRGCFTVIAVLRDLPAQEDLLFFLAESQRPQIAHAELAHHLARKLGGSLNIIACTGAHLVQEHLFRDPAAHHDGDLSLQIFLGVIVFVVDGQLHGDAQRHSAWDDGHFVYGVGFWQFGRYQRVSCLMVGRHFLLLFGED